MSGVLDGIRVVELGQVLAGPFAGAILGDLGAEVIKVERLDDGDDARTMGPAFRHGDALNFHMFNRNKRSVALDLKSAVGLATLGGCSFAGHQSAAGNICVEDLVFLCEEMDIETGVDLGFRSASGAAR